MNRRVLFVRSGNNGIDPISTNQGISLAESGWIVKYYDVNGTGIRGYLSNVPKLRKCIKETDPALIHAHYSLSGYLAVLSAGGIPVVTSLMGSDLLKISVLSGFFLRFFVRFFWAATIVKTTEMMKKLDVKNVVVIPNGVNLDRFKPGDVIESRKKLGWSLEEKHILFGSDPGRPEKNSPLFHKAVEKAGEIYRNIRIHYLVDIPGKLIPDYYNASDIMVLTSFHEGSPNVVKEAMACNCPVISTDTGDVKSIIAHSRNCYTTGFNDFEISQRMIDVLNDGGRSNGRDAIKPLDSITIALKISEVYNKLI